MDMNMIIANNILAILEDKNIGQSELADALHTNKQIINKMLNGISIINAIELRLIADYLGVNVRKLTSIDKEINDSNIIDLFKGKVDSKQANKALEIADNLSDMILFHRKVRENGMEMLNVLDEDNDRNFR